MVQLISTYVYTAFGPIIFLAMKARNDAMVWNKWGIFWVALGAFVATVANYAFLFAIQNKPVHEVMSFTQLYPILSFALCWLLLGEVFTFQKVIGAILMVAGCIIMNR
jgi:drug/metabolite transporter (DMT)-like permease